MAVSDNVSFHCNLKTNILYIYYFKHRFLQVFFCRCCLNLVLVDLILFNKKLGKMKFKFGFMPRLLKLD